MIFLFKVLIYSYIILWVFQMIIMTIGLFNNDEYSFFVTTRKRYLIAINPLWIFILINNSLKNRDEELDNIQRKKR